LKKTKGEIPLEILFKYCGGCNPRIDRGKLAREIRQRADVFAHEAGSLVMKPGAENLLILINGCPAACGSVPQQLGGEKCLVVTGSLLEGREGEEEELAGIIMEHLKKTVV
jgi:hypothetical protein